ncbi:nucleolar protein NAN1 [Scheffersomyces amazonensis]|uniref:nucleolar protein NAN1 n=1 Tax=Scheffersomyces amazonensis TaxID=1078765 RepID=UPI00315E0043
MTNSSSDWSSSMATGGKPVYLGNSTLSSSIFSGDGRFNIVVLTHQIRVYFISTRQCIRTIDIELGDVVDLRLDSSNPSHVLLFKSNGEILTVNWKDKNSQPIVSTIQLDLAFSLLSVVSIREDSYYIITGKKDKKITGSPHTRYIQVVNRHDPSQITTLTEFNNIIKYTTSLDYTKIVFITNSHDVILVNLTDVYKKSKQAEFEEDLTQFVSVENIAFPFKSPITSLAVSNDSTIALGTSSGAIQIIYGGLATEKPQRLLKWHIDQVKALQFTPDNSYLLSGGLEKVLVFWQLETDNTQFLPRLNGTVEKISLEQNKSEYYSLLLNVSSTKLNDENSNEEDNYEVLVLSSVDLVSRLSVNTIRPKFANNVKTTLAKSKKKYSKSPFDKTKLRHDYSTVFEVHPKTKNLYFPNEAVIQAYDIVKNEQAFVQNAAPVLTTGKVRSEVKLLDPNVSLISFTQDGEWMCTFDSVSNSEVDNLLSKNDKQYALKFWKFIESGTKNEPNATTSKSGYWELSTKIIDPHGNSNAILSIKPSPSSYYNGLAFITADNKGGVRVWRPRIPKEIYSTVKNGSTRQQQTAWTLRKSRAAGAVSSDAVDVCWSDDSSIIVLAHEFTITPIDTQTFEDIPSDVFNIPSLSGSRVRALSIVDNNLIILSKTRISSFNLLSGQLTELVAKVNTTIGGKNLITVDPRNNLICLAVNYYNDESSDFTINSKVLIFKPDQLKPIYSQYHNQGIAAVRCINSSFIFVDLDTRVGIVQPTTASPYSQGEEDDVDNSDSLSTDINNMLISAQATADIINDRSVSINRNSQKTQNQTQTQTPDDNMDFNRVIDVHTFQPIFENIEGLTVDSIFERITKILK